MKRSTVVSTGQNCAREIREFGSLCDVPCFSFDVLLIYKILGSESFTRCFVGVKECKEYKGVRGSCSKKTQLFVSAKILTNLITAGGL